MIQPEYYVGTTHAYDDGTIATRMSSDGGRTWSEQRILWSVEPGFSAQNVVALAAPSGRIIIWTARYEYGPSPHIRHPSWWSHSNDHGRTWAPFALFERSEVYNCYYVTEAIDTSDGLLAGDATFPATGVGNCHTRIWHSADDGNTWKVRSNLTNPAENHGDEIALMETKPGTILCLLRDRSRTDTFRLWSHDKGHTWSDRESMNDMLGCVLH
ncbi:sialidase family protein, partial [Verrucomicrobiota bacterium]